MNCTDTWHASSASTCRCAGCVCYRTGTAGGGEGRRRSGRTFCRRACGVVWRRRRHRRCSCGAGAARGVRVGPGGGELPLRGAAVEVADEQSRERLAGAVGGGGEAKAAHDGGARAEKRVAVPLAEGCTRVKVTANSEPQTATITTTGIITSRAHQLPLSCIPAKGNGCSGARAQPAACHACAAVVRRRTAHRGECECAVCGSNAGERAVVVLCALL